MPSQAGQILEQLRVKLLDLSKRNKLISFRHSDRSRKQLRFVGLTLGDAFDRLEAGAGIEVAPLPLPESEPADEQTPEFLDALGIARNEDPEYLEGLKRLGPTPAVKPQLLLEAKLRDRLRIQLGLPPIVRDEIPSKAEYAKQLEIDPSFELGLGSTKAAGKRRRFDLQTLLFPEELERNLSAIYQQARLSESEAGVNTLFLAFGFIEWYESDSSDEPIYSPLLLYPVEVERKLKDDDYIYTVKGRDEDLAANICLIEKLKDLSIALPLPIEDELPSAYITRVKAIIEPRQKKWRIHSNLTLGFFSFAKLVMFHDLGKAATSHSGPDSSASKLLVGSENDPNSDEFTEAIIDDALIDKHVPSLIKDADSTQIRALLAAASGKDIVIEGPPGTGKSQTITNIIAAVLAQGKTVLFVAEKRAALEVVKNRLDDANLGVFCLELHSKVRKPDVLKSLSQRLQKSVQGRHHYAESTHDRALEVHERIRNGIATHLERMHAQQGRLGMSIHDIFWRHLRLRQLHPSFQTLLKSTLIPKAKKTTQVEMEGNARLLTSLEKILPISAEHPNPQQHPWHPFVHPYSLKASLQALLDSAEYLATHLPPTIASLATESAYPQPDAKALDTHIEMLAKFEECDKLLTVDINDRWLKSLSEKDNQQALRAYVKTVNEHASAVNALAEDLTSEFREDHLPQLETMIELGNSHGLSNEKLGSLQETTDATRRKTQQLQEVWGFRNPFEEFSGITLGSAATNVHAALQVVALLREITPEILALRSETFGAAENAAQIDSILTRIADMQQRHQAVAIQFTLEKNVPRELLEEAVQTLGNYKWWSLLTPRYWRARSLYKSLALRLDTPTAQSMGQELKELLLFRQAEAQLATDSHVQRILGQHFSGERTPTEELRTLSNWQKKVRAGLPSYNRIHREIAALALWGPLTKVLGVKGLSDYPRIDEFEQRIKALGQDSDLSFDSILPPLQTLITDCERLKEIVVHTGLNEALSFSDLKEVLKKIKRVIALKSKLETQRKANLLIEKAGALTSEQLAQLERTTLYCDAIIGCMSAPLYETLIIEGSQKRLASMIEWARNNLRSLSDIRAALERIIALDKSEPNRLADLRSMAIGILSEQAAKAIRRKELVDELSEYITIDSDIRAAHLRTVVDAFDANSAQYKDLADAYEYALLNTLIDEALDNTVGLKRSAGHQLDELRNDFIQADNELMGAKQKRLGHQLLQVYAAEGVTVGLPRDLTQSGLIKHEIQKVRKHIPVRQLIYRAGDAIQALKPCIMMSPLSVAQFIGLDSISFDVVIMDEASQMRPEDALGAVVRAKQVIIVGDPKQLPPTDFFVSNDTDEPIEENEVYDDGYESILDLALRSFKRAHRLKWHYRSKHESLIAFSNHQFYDGELVIFPSPHHDHEQYGVKHVDCKGVYEHRRNMIEAEILITQASDFMRQNPTKSLGIVAVNQEQRELLEGLLDRRAKTDSAVETYRGKWEGTLEPLFVKNLENVQGDERDAIFISTVYGPDSSGKLYQRFGPINSKTGHRRLNVLFSRAKYLMRVFSSMNPDDLVTDTRSSLGLRSLKAFLQFARDGRLGGEALNTGKPPDSDFEQFVMNALRDHGYEVTPQVGVSGFHIDLGVTHPMHPGKYVLGIECDGATYHGSKSARDRDKIRQEILEHLGWRIHRVWSTDWFHHPERELTKILEKLPPINRS